MKIIHEYDIADDDIKYLVNELNRLEYKGKLTFEKVKADTALFEYLFRKEVINDVLNGEIEQAWNCDMFCEVPDYL